MANLLGTTTIGGHQAIHIGNISSYAGISIATGDARYLQLSGGTLTGGLNVSAGGTAINITGAAGQVSFKDGDNIWTGYVGFSGNTGVLSFPGRNITINTGYNGTLTLETGVAGYNSGRVYIPQGYLFVENNYIQSGSAMYSPIYYDGNDSNFYVNPNGYSRLSRMYIGGSTHDYEASEAVIALANTQSNHNYLVSNGAGWNSWNQWIRYVAGYNTWRIGTFDEAQESGTSVWRLAGRNRAGNSELNYIVAGPRGAWGESDRVILHNPYARYDGGSYNGDGTLYKIIDSSNIGSQSVNYAASAGNSNTTSQVAFTDLKGNFPSGGSGGHSFGQHHYSMGLDVGNGGWPSPHYRDLIIGYHTGIRIGAHYSGIRFYNDSPTTDANNDGNGDSGEALLMTIGGYVGTANHTDVVVNNNLFANASMRAPIFYDSNDTNYYLDPNGTSNLSRLLVPNASSGASLIVGINNTSRVIDDNARKGLVVNADYYPHIYVNALSNASNDVHGAVISMTGVLSAGGYRRWGMGIANTDPSALSWGWWDNEPNPHYSVGGSLGYTSTGSRMWLDTGGNLQTTGSMRAPIFYDSNDTNYYGDFASTSRMNTIVYDDLKWAGDQTYGLIGRNGYLDTLNGRGGDPLELNYYDGGPVKIGSGTYGSKDLYAAMVYVSSGNAVIHAGNIGSQSVSYASSAGNADTLDGYHANTVGNRHFTARGFTVDGDANTYYPVIISGSGNYAFNRYSIYRHYNWTAPWDPIGTGVHKGGLTFDFEWSGDPAWGGNDHTLRVVQFSEQYTSMVAGLALPVTHGTCVWLRGGGAYYECQVDGYPVTPMVYLDGFTAANGSVYSPRTDTSNVQGEILNRMPVISSSDLYDGGNRVIHVGGDQTKSGYLQSNSSLRAPIVYDSNDTNYYGDFASESRFNTFTTAGSVVIGGTFGNNPYNSVASTRLLFGGGNGPDNYFIGTNMESYGGNYTKLDLRWHTGIRMGARPGYGGIRFFNDETLGSRIMSIGETDANIRIDNNLWIGGAGGWITDLLNAKQNASTAITTSNIGDQSVNYAASAGAVAWTNVSSRPTALSQFTNDLGNYGGWLTTSGKAADSELVDGIDSSRIIYGDGGFGSTNYSDMNNTAQKSGFFFYNNPNGGPFGDWTHWINSMGNSWNPNYGFQLAHAFHSDRFAVRVVANGGWGSWRTVIDSGNIGSQSVSYASSAGNADTVDGKHATNTANNLAVYESNGYLYIPNWLNVNSGGIFSSTNNAHIRPNTGSYGAWEMIGSRNGWSGIYFNDSGDYLMANSSEVGHYQHGVGWKFRWYLGQMYVSRNNTGGGTEYTVLDSGNYSSWAIARGGDTVSGIIYFLTNNGGRSGATDSAKLQAYSTGNNAAFMSFHKSGVYAINFGLDDDNVMRMGGWSAASDLFQMDMSGTLTMKGDVIAFSDARVKENIQTLDGALEKTLKLRGVSYNRIDIDDKSTKIGVIAQEILEVVPEVVSQDANGTYGVSYGNIVGLLIEAIKEQQQQINNQQQQIDDLLKNLGK